MEARKLPDGLHLYVNGRGMGLIGKPTGWACKLHYRKRVSTMRSYLESRGKEST